jgi:hypothetical protein
MPAEGYPGILCNVPVCPEKVTKEHIGITTSPSFPPAGLESFQDLRKIPEKQG